MNEGKQALQAYDIKEELILPCFNPFSAETAEIGSVRFALLFDGYWWI